MPTAPTKYALFFCGRAGCCAARSRFAIMIIDVCRPHADDTGMTTPTAQSQMPDHARPPCWACSPVRRTAACAALKLVSAHCVRERRTWDKAFCSGSACHLAEPLRRPDLRTVLSFCTRDAAAAISAAQPDAASCQRPQITSTRGFVAVSTKQLNCFACKKFSSTALLWHEHSRNLADMRVPCGVGPTMALHLSA